MRIALVAAMAENRVIGSSNCIPWCLPKDLKHFREITTGHPVIMGRKTYDSIGHPLPGRHNIVISRQQGLKIEGCEVVSSLEDALELAKSDGAEEADVIGGGEIYRQALPLADRMYLTIVHAEFPGDTSFPEFSEEEWKEVSRERHEPDEKNPYSYTFLTYERRR
jgi:dihydrofolate reductase